MNINLKWVGVHYGEEYVKLTLVHVTRHIYIPFNGDPRNDERRRNPSEKASYYSHAPLNFILFTRTNRRASEYINRHQCEHVSTYYPPAT